MAQTYKLGTRRSPLALRQAKEIYCGLKKFHPDLKIKIIGINTYGDRDKITPISEIEGTDFFTKEIDDALLGGEIDFAVHSAKDLPDRIAQGLQIAAMTKSIDPYDALVSKGNLRIDQLRPGAKIGASSARRKQQLKNYRQDFQVADIRGNIHERLEEFDSDGWDAVVIASCALIRLGLEDRISQGIPLNILKPHPLQGALAIVARQDSFKLIKLLKVLDER